MPAQKKKTRFIARGVQRGVDSRAELIGDSFADLLQAKPRANASIDLRADRSDQAADHRIACSKDDVVELRLEGDLRIYTSVERLEKEIIPPEQSRGAKKGEFQVPRRIRFPNQRSRGIEEILVEAVEILDLKGKLADLAGQETAKLIAGLLEDRLVGDGGLFSLEQIQAGNDPDKSSDGVMPEPVDSEQIDVTRPLLIFIHGTASTTHGSFSDLWTSSIDDVWGDLEKIYGNNIFAFEHRSLTHSPLRNALDLASVLPKGARVHLVSHSRGGLVGELLCRGQFRDGRDPFTQDDRTLFEPNDNSGLQAIFEEGADPADYQQHLADLDDLNDTLKRKGLRVERFVRVACPARGTTLASGRLDIFLSTLLNLIGLIPALKISGVYDFLKAFLLAVAKTRTRPQELPGLEAQMPSSPFIAMLNGTRDATNAHLAVVSGDIEPKGILKKLALFLVDRFYASDHDLVVNTPSMDGGGNRARSIPILPRQGEEVHHFSYFSKGPSRRGLLAALRDAESPAGFQLRKARPVAIARSLPRDRKSGEVPVVFLLPGISGSHIERDGNRIWVDVFDLIRGKLKDLHIDAEDVRAEALVASAYADLADYLGRTHEVIPFPYDWRKSILDASDELAGRIDERLRNSDQPVRIVAHSMGGLVARGMMAQQPHLWDLMRQREGSRVLMLGTPNSGSHSIVRLFAKQEKLIKWLAVADIRNDQDEILELLRKFPGVLELLPVTDDGGFFANPVWKSFEPILGADWPKPLVNDLRDAKNVWDRLHTVSLDPAHVFYIAGRADETPNEVRVEGDRIRFFATRRGDGRVPWEGGIPEGIRHWFVDASHGDLADHEPAFEAIAQILKRGDTRLLATQPPLARGADKLREMFEDEVELLPDGNMLEGAALGSERLLGLATRARRQAELPPIEVSVCHGNLRFTDAPVLVGHYLDDTIVSAEAEIDRQLDGRLNELYRLGLYPGAFLSNEVLLDETGVGRFPGAVIVGLDRVGTLSSGKLIDTYRDALLRYAVAVRQRDTSRCQPIRLVSVLVGTGSGGIWLDDAITAMLRAAVQANRLLAGPNNIVDRIITELQFIELFEDVAVRAQKRLVEISNNAEFKGLVRARALIQTGDGGQTRVYYGEDPAWWQRLRIEATKEGGLKFTALTERARAEVAIQPTQRQSVEPFLNASTADTTTDSQAGRVIYELIIPHDFKNFAQERRNLVLVLDAKSAAYPWELLEYRGRDGNEALARQGGMIRQLATKDYSPSNLTMNGRALVIGDPQYGMPDFPALDGARKEAQEVAVLLGQRFGDTEPLDNPTGKEILTQLMAHEFQVLHLAGHGVFEHQLPGSEDKVSGMVIGPDHILTPIEIRQMPATPELVFINCCHIGKMSDHSTKVPDQPHRLAANLAIQLINQGVRAVIAAGWAVDDAAARTFALRFYEKMLDGESFGSSVSAARDATYSQHPGVNTWGAYQCYGDPEYRLENCRGGRDSGDTQARVALAEFIADIRNIAQKAKTASEDEVDGLRQWLDQIEKDLLSLPNKSSAQGELLAALGEARSELGQFERALSAYKQAVFSEDALASIRADEQRANLQARYAVDLAGEAAKRLAEKAASEKPDSKGNDNDDLFAEARGLIKDAIRRLDILRKSYGETVERSALLGSAHKRGALVETHAGSELDVVYKHLNASSNFYNQSHVRALQTNGSIYAYPLINWLTITWLMYELGYEVQWPTGFEDLLRSVEEANPVPELNRAYFWNAVTQADCALLRALSENALADREKPIADVYLRLRRYLGSPRQFSSIMDQFEFLRLVLEHGKPSDTIDALGRITTLLRSG